MVNHHLQRRRKTYYFVKRVPKDVKQLHPSGSIRESLKTTDVATARKMRDRRLKELEGEWSAFRALPKGKHIDRHLLKEALDFRRHVLNDEDRRDVLEAVEDRTNTLYQEDVPEHLDGETGSEQANEFYLVASARKLPVQIAVEEFLKGANLKPSTRNLYRGLLQQLNAEFMFLEDMTRDAVRRFLRTYQSTRTTKAINNLITAGRSLLSYHDLDPKVFEAHRIDAGKALLAKGIWTDKEVLRLANSNSSQWLRDCITIAMYSGLRRQEVCGLVYDAEKDQLVVEASRAKTTNSIRRIPCHPTAREAAKRISSASPRVRLNRLTVGMRELTDRLGISRTVVVDGVTYKRDFHALRHTFASKLASLGTEQSTIARILGHAPSSVTGRYASKVDPEVDRGVIEGVSFNG